MIEDLYMLKVPFFVAVLLLTFWLSSVGLNAKEWTIAAGGNCYPNEPEVAKGGLGRGGVLAWSEPAESYSFFFHVNQAAKLSLKLIARSSDGAAKLLAECNQNSAEVVIKEGEFQPLPCGTVTLTSPGYVRVNLKGVSRTGKSFGEIQALVVQSEFEGLEIDFVKNNEGNMFYWGRRGPSVHLSYEVPKDKPIRYGYSEITVPVGEDPIGSYYMANGFGEGYFGIQVNSSSERRVLFSVWSPFQTDNPKDIPEDQRIESLGRGPEVRIGEFGNEGSGGQSYLIYPWKAGKTYRFLTEVKPDGKGSTIYTSWFGDKGENEWRLIASFRRPQTNTNLRGFHSFLESFNPTYGHIGRKARYGNVWVVDTNNEWHECTSARFSVDPTGGNRHRLDFDGGVEEKSFFLRNCGFFSETGKPGDNFARSSTANERPSIDFETLPR